MDYLKAPPKASYIKPPNQRPDVGPQDPYASARAHLERARKHVNDLEAVEKSIRREDTFFDIVDHDPKTGDDIYKFCGFFVPWEASAILWDAVTNLRDSLDHAYGAALGASGKAGKKTHFPFAESAAALEKSLSGVPASIAGVIRQAKPFKSGGDTEGNDALWTIGTLSNSYKAGAASALATAVASLNGFTRLELPNGGELTQPPIWDADKNELEFARAPHGSILRHKYNLKIEIGFGDSGFLRSKPAVSTLRELIEQASGVCAGLEQATR
jgi:hypothetical protein